MAGERIATGLSETIGKGEDPLYYYTLVYLAFLQGLFKEFPEGNYKYSEDEELTEIIIADQAAKSKEAVPRIITMRGPAQFTPIGFFDMITQKSGDWTQYRSLLIASSMSINCISKNGVEAQKLAIIVASALIDYKQLLQKNGFHKIDENISIGPETPANSVFSPEVVPEGVLVTVQSPFFIRWSFRAAPTNNPIFKGIKMTMRTLLGPSDDTYAKEQYEKFHRQSTLLYPKSPLPSLDAYANIDVQKLSRQDAEVGTDSIIERENS